MLLRPIILLATAAGLVTAASAAGTDAVLDPRDFATVSGALSHVNAFLLQMNTAILNLDAQNIATSGPALLQVGQTILPSLQTVAAQVVASTLVTADETNKLNEARIALGKLLFDFMAFVSGAFICWVWRIRELPCQSVQGLHLPRSTSLS